MPFTPQQSATEILSLFVASGARPGRAFPVMVSGTSLYISEFPGALQAAFLGAGYAISDLVAGLGYAVTQGWLSLGQSYGGSCQLYVLEQAGWTEAGGTAPTLAASAQQLINVCAAQNGTAGAVSFKAAALVSAFVGTVGGNTFAIEDLLPGAYYAVAQGWLRPTGDEWFAPVFALTAAGVAQAT